MQGKLIKFKENHYSWGARSHISFVHVIAAEKNYKRAYIWRKIKYPKCSLAQFLDQLIFYCIKFMRQDFEPCRY